MWTTLLASFGPRRRLLVTRNWPKPRKLREDVSQHPCCLRPRVLIASLQSLLGTGLGQRVLAFVQVSQAYSFPTASSCSHCHHTAMESVVHPAEKQSHHSLGNRRLNLSCGALWSKQ